MYIRFMTIDLIQKGLTSFKTGCVHTAASVQGDSYVHDEWSEELS